MTEVSSKTQPTLRVRLLRALIVVVAVVVVALVALWFGRKALAQRAVQSWCNGLTLTCNVEFAELDLSSASLRDFEIRNGSNTPFAAEVIDIAYSWSGLTQVGVDKISLKAPIIHGVLEDEGVSFYGLEAAYELDASDEPSTAPPPHVIIENGQAFLETAAGEVSAAFEADGRLIEDGTVKIELTPARLRHENASLVWTRGDVDLQFFSGAVTGQVKIDIEQADLGALSAVNTHVSADITDKDGELQLTMNGEANRVSNGAQLGRGIVFNLVASAERPTNGDTFGLQEALRSLTFDATAAELTDETLSAQAISILANLMSDDGELAGPIALEAEDIKTDVAEVGSISVSGELTQGTHSEETPSLAYNGKFFLTHVNASSVDVLKALNPSDLPSAVQPHAAQIKRVLEAGLSDFNFGASFQSALGENSWQVIARDPTALQAGNGLVVSLEPLAGQPWLEASDQLIELSGLIKLGGGGGPDFQTYLEEVSWRNGELKLFARDGVLEDWTVDGALVHAQFGGLSYEQGARRKFFVDGEVALAGNLDDMTFERTRLFGKLEGAHGGEGWRVQTIDSKCVGLTMGGVQAGTVALDPLALALCPEDGRFTRQEDGKTVGRINLGNIRLPFATGDSSGTFIFDAAMLDWSSGDELEMTIKGRSLALPMVFGDTTLTVSSTVPSVSAVVGDGPLRILAALDDTHFGGTMIPANVRADSFVFEGLATENGLEGSLRGKAVHISDINADPLYEPLVSDMEAVLRDGEIDLSGPLLNENTQTPIADLHLQLHLAKLNGSAQVKMRELSFSPGGLQPTALTEQLRGVLTNTSGGLSGQADINIIDGELDGTGEILVSNLSFDTLKAGSVNGVNGRLAFWDVLGLQSEPHQVFTIDEINPGIPLTSGLIRFQLKGAELTKLETARWPFAGGVIRVRPTEWTVGGDSESVMVELEGIELDQLVETLKVPDLIATGTVSGAFPIEFVGANIMVRQAVLKADEQGGTLAYTGGATDAIEGQNEYTDYGLEAIKDFDFTVMELGLDGNLIGRLLLSVDLLGSNDNVLDGAAFKFGLTVDSDLVPLLESLNGTPTESYLSEGLALERDRLERERAAEQSK